MIKESHIKAFDYKDVILVPKKAAVKSRSEVDTSIEFGGRKFKAPTIPANMSTIVDIELAEWLASNGYFYIMHRFDVDPVEFTTNMHQKGLISSVSVGVKDVDYENISELASLNITPEYITIDIAHGHADSVITMIKHIKAELPDSFVIAGNVGSVEGALELEQSGADAIKAGIAPGCFTGEMEVNTESGMKKIRDIQAGDKVLTHKGHYREVLGKSEFNHHEELMTINGIECTPDHEFYVCNAEDINKINEDNYESFCYWVQAQNLVPEKHKVVSISSNK